MILINMKMKGLFNGHCDPRREQEYRDGQMIREDHKAMANCPRQAIHHTFDEDMYVEHFKRYNQKEYKGYL